MCIFDQEDWIFPQQFEIKQKESNEIQISSNRSYEGQKNYTKRRSEPKKTNLNKKKDEEKKKDEKNETKNKEQRKKIQKILPYYTNQIDSREYQKTNRINFDDGFLEEDEFAELKGKYDDFGLGDLVIVFQNPDYEGKDKVENHGVKFKDAMKVYDTTLSVINEQTQKSQLEIERKSFILAFLTLSDYSNKDKNDHSKQQLESYKNYKSKQVQIENQKKEYEDYKQRMKEAEEQEENGNLAIYPTKISKDKYRNYDPIKELLKVDVGKTEQFQQEIKQYCHGGYAKEQDEWLCTNRPPQDFLTLVRFTIITKLNLNCKLHTRQFISSDGKEIFLIIKSQTQNIREQAQNMKISKQLELGYADIFSLEPCDKNFRPLRLKDHIRNSQSDKIQKLIKQIKIDKERRNNSINEDRINKMVGAFAEKTQMGYRKIQLWNEDELQAQIICKQQEIDKYIKQIGKDLQIDQNYEKVVVIEDDSISQQEWQAYYVYMQYFEYFMQHMDQLQQYEEIKQNKPLLYKLIFRKALGASNQLWLQYNNTFIQNIFQGKKILQNIWDRLNLPPIAPFANYFDPSQEKDSQQRMWRQFDINENNLREEFLCMEKIKITNALVLRNINLLKLIKDGFVKQYFPIHDPYQLKGQVKKPMFESLEQEGLLNQQKEQTVGDKLLKILFEEMADEAESTDYNPESLDFDAQFNYQTPWKIPIEALRNYFGDKLGIYFCFMQFYAQQLSYMAFIGLIAQILISQLSGEIYDAFTIIFSCIIILWSTVFIELWKREEVQYSVQFGQQNFENDEAERPQFYGIMRRSIKNDDLNELFYSPFIRKMKTMLSLAISLMILVMVILVNVGIFRLKEQQSPLPYMPAVLQAIQIQFFNIVYSKLGEKFNDYENHQIFSSYENSFIIKSFLFTFVNTFISFFIIAFLSSYFIGLNLCIVDDKNDCFKTLQNQLITIFLTVFAQKIVENVQSYFTVYNNEIQLQKKKEIKIKHSFNQIDQFIESQAKLIAYQTNEEVDGTVNDYTEVLIQFAFISLFGLAFPLSFTLAFIRNLIEIQSDMRKFIKYQLRPFPQGASNIGNWKIMLEFITFFGIFTNAGLIVYTSGTIESYNFQWFVILIVLFLGLKFFIRFLIPDTPQNIITLNSRHQFLADKLIKGAKNIDLDFNPIKPNLNLAGLNQVNKQNIKEKSK